MPCANRRRKVVFVASLWVLDCPPNDPDSNYPASTAAQLLIADDARDKVVALKRTLEHLTVPQQRAILNVVRDELVGGVYREVYRNGGPGKPIASAKPAGVT
jgi:hypothetical protein